MNFTKGVFFTSLFVLISGGTLFLSASLGVRNLPFIVCLILGVMFILAVSYSWSVLGVTESALMKRVGDAVSAERQMNWYTDVVLRWATTLGVVLLYCAAVCFQFWHVGFAPLLQPRRVFGGVVAVAGLSMYVATPIVFRSGRSWLLRRWSYQAFCWLVSIVGLTVVLW